MAHTGILEDRNKLNAVFTVDERCLDNEYRSQGNDCLLQRCQIPRTFYTNKIDFGSGPSNIKCLVALTIQKINHETLKSVDFLSQVSEATLIPHYLD